MMTYHTENMSNLVTEVMTPKLFTNASHACKRPIFLIFVEMIYFYFWKGDGEEGMCARVRSFSPPADRR